MNHLLNKMPFTPYISLPHFLYLPLSHTKLVIHTEDDLYIVGQRRRSCIPADRIINTVVCPHPFRYRSPGPGAQDYFMQTKKKCYHVCDTSPIMYVIQSGTN